MFQRSVCLLSLLLFVIFFTSSTSAKIVKRDTVEEIRESIADALGIDNDENLMKRLEKTEIDPTKYCIEDDNCDSSFQYCNKENNMVGIYGVCEWNILFWSLIAVGIFVVLSVILGIVAKLLCCRK